MPTVLTSKGQVTIPKKLRDYLGVKSGSPVEFELAADGRVVVRAIAGASKLRSRFAKARGSATVKLSTDEIMEMTRGRPRK